MGTNANVINPLLEINMVFSLIPLYVKVNGSVIALETPSVFKVAPDWKTVPPLRGV